MGAQETKFNSDEVKLPHLPKQVTCVCCHSQLITSQEDKPDSALGETELCFNNGADSPPYTIRNASETDTNDGVVAASTKEV